MFDEGDVLEAPAEVLAPVYTALDEEDEDSNMSCSRKKNEFCFLCTLVPHVCQRCAWAHRGSRYTGSDTDQLREYIDTLVKSGRELGAIAKAVHSVCPIY